METTPVIYTTDPGNTKYFSISESGRIDDPFRFSRTVGGTHCMGPEREGNPGYLRLA